MLFPWKIDVMSKMLPPPPHSPFEEIPAYAPT